MSDIKKLGLAKLRAAIDRRIDAVLMGTPDVMESSAQNLNAALEAVERQFAVASTACPDCGSPMPGEMCAVCALRHAERELVELRKDAARLDWLSRNPPNREGKPATSLSREQIDTARGVLRTYPVRPHTPGPAPIETDWEQRACENIDAFKRKETGR